MPPRGWQPDPDWPAAPFGWRYFVEDPMGDESREVSGAVARSEWLRDVQARPARPVSVTPAAGIPRTAVTPPAGVPQAVDAEAPAVQAARAAQVARKWAGLDENAPIREFGTVRWAGEGDTPDAGLTLSRPKVSESWLASTGTPGAAPAGSPESAAERAALRGGVPDVTDWLDRLYERPAEVPEVDLGPLDRAPRRSGTPAHAANAPGRFRDLVETPIPTQPTRKPSRPPGKRLVVPMVVLVGLAGFALGRSALDAVDPAKGEITLADSPLLTGQKGPSGALVTVSPKTPSAETSSATSDKADAGSGSGSGSGKHKAETPSAEATAQELEAAADVGAGAGSGAQERPRTTTTTTSLATPNRDWSATTRSEPKASTRDNDDREHSHDRWRGYDGKRDRDRDPDRRGRHRKPDENPWRCDPNYAKACVPVASDVDCLDGGGDGPVYLSQPARVIGKDVYGLDTNGDGWACEPW